MNRYRQWRKKKPGPESSAYSYAVWVWWNEALASRSIRAAATLAVASGALWLREGGLALKADTFKVVGAAVVVEVVMLLVSLFRAGARQRDEVLVELRVARAKLEGIELGQASEGEPPGPDPRIGQLQSMLDARRNLLDAAQAAGPREVSDGLWRYARDEAGDYDRVISNLDLSPKVEAVAMALGDEPRPAFWDKAGWKNYQAEVCAALAEQEARLAGAVRELKAEDEPPVS